MSKVSITRSKLDALAVAVSVKSGEELPLTIDEMREAVNGISGGSVTVTDEPNATGVTCVITTGGEPVPPTPSETWETIHEGNVNFYHDNNNSYPYCWISTLSSVTIPVDSVWRVTYSGNEYRCTAAYDSTLATACIGNPKYAGGGDDGSNNPFSFSNQGWGAWTGNIDAPNQDAIYQLKIERLVTE